MDVEGWLEQQSALQPRLLVVLSFLSTLFGARIETSKQVFLNSEIEKAARTIPLLSKKKLPLRHWT